MDFRECKSGRSDKSYKIFKLVSEEKVSVMSRLQSVSENEVGGDKN